MTGGQGFTEYLKYNKLPDCFEVLPLEKLVKERTSGTGPASTKTAIVIVNNNDFVHT